MVRMQLREDATVRGKVAELLRWDCGSLDRWLLGLHGVAVEGLLAPRAVLLAVPLEQRLGEGVDAPVHVGDAIHVVVYPAT